MPRTLQPLTVLLVLGLLAGFFAHSQYIPGTALVSLAATPSSPSPGETVTIEAFTPTVDKAVATYIWTVNGRFQENLSGVGKTALTLTAGEVGSTIAVGVIVEQGGAEVGSASLSIPVSNLAITWSANTLLPRWYKGKALPAPGSTVTVAATPAIVLAGAAIKPEALIYRWSIGDQRNVLSGVGERVLQFRMSNFPKTTHQIKLVVEDARGQIRKEGQTLITTRDPRVALYRASPLGGIDPRSSLAAEYYTRDQILDIVAEPFFYPVASKKALSYKWSTGGVDVEGAPQNPDVLTLDLSRQTTGSISVSVTVDDANILIPPIIKTLSLIFQ